LSGWKTWLGVISAVLGGIGLMAHGAAGDKINVDELMAGLAMLSGAFAALGIGHKVEKAADKIAVVVAGKPVVVATDSIAVTGDVGAGESVVAKPLLVVKP
jgi:hypothetical protein